VSVSKPTAFLATNPFVNDLLRWRLANSDVEVLGEVPDAGPVPADCDPRQHWLVQLEKQIKGLADKHQPPDIVFLSSAGVDTVRLSQRLLDVCPTLVVYFTPVGGPVEADGLVYDRRSTQIREVTVRSWKDAMEVIHFASSGDGRPESRVES
jgi:hypothetical protein